MESEQAHPARRMDGVCMRMMALFGDPGRNVMDRDDPVEDHNDHENKQSKSEVVQEGIANHFTPLHFRGGFGSEGGYPIKRGQNRFVPVNGENQKLASGARGRGSHNPRPRKYETHPYRG
jgi:hypothetical protein